MVRVCYHVQSHRNPRQILRLVRRIRSLSPASIVLLSHQVGGDPLDEETLRADGSVHVLPTSGGYGDFSHIDRYLDSARWLIDHDEPFDWFVNVSAQDYPIVDLRAAENELAHRSVDALVETFPVFADGSHWSRRRAMLRYGYRHRRLGAASARAYTWSRPLAAINRLQPWVCFSPAYMTVGIRAPMPFGPEFVCFGGSFFANLSRPAVFELLSFCDRRPDFVDWARHVAAPEEIFIQTVLGNAPDLTVHDDCRRYFDFSRSRGNHPKTLTEDDLPRMLASNAWFARKFDEDAPVLDRIDELLDEHATA